VLARCTSRGVHDSVTHGPERLRGIAGDVHEGLYPGQCTHAQAGLVQSDAGDVNSWLRLPRTGERKRFSARCDNCCKSLHRQRTNNITENHATVEQVQHPDALVRQVRCITGLPQRQVDRRRL